MSVFLVLSSARLRLALYALIGLTLAGGLAGLTLCLRSPRADSRVPTQAAQAPFRPDLRPLALPASPQPAATPELEGERAWIQRARREASENCLIADLAALGFNTQPAFDVRALLRALDCEQIQAGAYGELPALRREARWLASVRGAEDLGERSWEDVRLVAGALHWYLDGALEGAELAHESHVVRDYDRESLKAFRDLDLHLPFQSLLDEWD